MSIYVGDHETQQIVFPSGTEMRRVLGVYVGAARIFPPAGRAEEYLFTAGASGGTADGNQVRFSPSVPWWAVAVDVIVIGGGGGGHGGDGTISRDGQGGRAAAWQSGTFDLTQAEGDWLNTFSVLVGKGGSGGGKEKSGTAGAESKVSYGMQFGPTVSSPGGAGGSSYASATGQSADSFAGFGMSFSGGAGGSREQPGRSPGGGGGGGKGGVFGAGTAGAAGGDGSVWIRFRSAPAPGPGDEGFVLRVGVNSGDASAALEGWAVGIGKTYQTITEITVPIVVVGTSLQSLFNGCYALASVPYMDTSQVTDMYAMFTSCQALSSVPELNTSQATDMGFMFSGCSSLTSVPALDASRVTNMGSMFYDCSSLESVTLPGMGNSFTTQRNLDMRDTKLNAAAANALMQSLGTPPPGGTLQLPSTSAGADTSIATVKSWTVTFG